jgi:TonB family protein
VSSAANTVTPGNEAQGNESGLPRPNPVPLEAPVSVTGANTASQDGSRHLFSEETTTVLVFKDGAVIRLAASVSLGQLIFLTNKKTNQEVICQVLRTRSFKAGRSYVEVKFTEEDENYWGVEFPEEPKDTPEFQVPDLAQANETTAQPAEASVTPHSAEDVDKLKREVEALRAQLAAREKKDAAQAAAPDATARELATQNATKVMEAALGQSPKQKEELAPANDPLPPAHADTATQPPEPETLLMPSAPKDTSDAAPPVVSMSLPVWKLEKSPEEQLLEEEAAREASQAEQPAAQVVEKPAEQPAEELLPKPELDFSQAEKGTPQKKRAKTKATKAPKTGTTSSNTVRVIGLAAVLLLAVGGAWYGKWWQYLPLAKKAPAPAVTPHPVVQRPATVAAKSVNSVSTPSSPATNPAANDSTKPTSDNAPAANQDTPTQAPENESPLPEKRSAHEKHSLQKDIAKAQDSPSAAETPSDMPSQAVKLLKSVNPVYPPDAMRSYITGDIKAEVTVLPSGHVADVKVVSGPKALREAAVDALKQYQYSPATQGGKPVESKTTEVVKFWFNP